MELITVIGISASVLTASASIPQLVKLIKEKKSEGISIAMLFVLSTGLALWVYYGALKEDWIIIVSNCFALIVNVLTVSFVMYFKRT